MFDRHTSICLSVFHLSVCFNIHQHTVLISFVHFVLYHYFFRKLSLFIPQQRELLGSSAQISSGVCWCGSQEQVPEEVSGHVLVWVPEAGSEGSGEFHYTMVLVPEASSGRFRKISEGSRVCWCRFRR